MEMSQLKKALDVNKLTFKGLAEKIGMTESGLRLSIKNETLSVKSLKRISEVLLLPIQYFFDEKYIIENRPPISQTVDNLNKYIDILENENKRLKAELNNSENKKNVG